MGKKIFIVFLATIIILSVGLCLIKPKMHKQFSLNIIEYAIKFNNGQAQTIKTITTTSLEEK